MDPITLLNTLSRVIHLGTAIVLVGGTVFMYFVLTPAAEKLPEEEHNKLRDNILNKWRVFVYTGITLFLISGFYNYLGYLVTGTPKPERPPLYHALIGIKILLALVIFFFSSALAGRSPALEGIRKKRKMWTGVVVLLAALVVIISGYVKIAVVGKASGDTSEEVQSEN